MIDMMKAKKLRQLFFEFFRSKNHLISPSAPMVVKDDPSLMFTNAGMNQFKDIFLGIRMPEKERIANSQKCLRVSGKHNDLEEVGHDTYHHTMFEMLGNWSFGNYFKKEAIEWAYEFLVDRLGIPEERLYATYFEGDDKDKVPGDEEALLCWKNCFRDPSGRILKGSKKDNFWEMGETGPCGPCSEIHIDIRDDEERMKKKGSDLVNKGHPQVLEIWNLVFIQYNRKKGGALEHLPMKHVDTGMGFERLCMVVQGKKSNYDTDIFQPLIEEISAITGKQYGKNEKWDVALRVIADHLRAVSFSIADGQVPSNNKAGYVIRRILRRAVRYGYNNLGTEEPFIYKLIPVLVSIMGDQYPELRDRSDHIAGIIHEEEVTFLRTLGKGLRMMEKMILENKTKNINIFPGKVAFEMYDTYGFPVDLTQIILDEHDMIVDLDGFEKEMKNQKKRSREDASVDAADWNIIRDVEGTLFTGYDKTEEEVLITRFRKIRSKGKNNYHLVFNKTPFYAESGGQKGDSGYIKSGDEKIEILDTVKENNVVIHISGKLPSDITSTYRAVVDVVKRRMTANNHTATHLIHFALRKVLGDHVEQRGSLVTHDRLRFDFSHFHKVTKDELLKVEEMVNGIIREDHKVEVTDGISLEKAHSMGAMALFGEKYEDSVRVVKFGESVELCGGTHVESTGSIGLIKIISESAVAAGIRRIEALTASEADKYVNDKLSVLEGIASLLRNPPDITESIEKMIAENSSLKKRMEEYNVRSANNMMKKLLENAIEINNIRLITGVLDNCTTDILKSIAHNIRKKSPETVLVIGSGDKQKASLVVMVTDDLLKQKNISAVDIIKEIAPEINGNGGGQPFLAVAGGSNPEGIENALKKTIDILKNL